MTNIHPPSAYQFSFGEVTKVAEDKNEGMLSLEPCVTKGFVQVYDLAEGLQARFWNSTLKPGIEAQGYQVNGFENQHFTLIFFVDIKDISGFNNDVDKRQSKIWDTVFMSSKSNYRLHLLPNIQAQCLSVSFSKKWLEENVLIVEHGKKNLKEKIRKTDTFPLFDCMDAAQQKVILGLFDSPFKSSLGCFSIKSCVLKVVSDFFIKLKETKTFKLNKTCVESIVNIAEERLISNLNGPIPNLKNLATSFSISESTLKRHFKNRFGITMSHYFAEKKREYANS